MNKAVTEGLLLSPPDFVDGLEVWSSENGTIGTITYDTNPAGSLVASDPDFGDCLEIIKSDSPQRLRYMGETPILPGCYLEVMARVKVISGPIPDLRIAAFPGNASGTKVNGLVETGPQVTLADYGRVYTVRAILGSGPRTGVDMVWGTAPVFAHIGLDILGSNGSVVRIESVRVEDRTDYFHRDLMDWVDVRDYGAIGDGVTNDAAAFETADANAAGREILVPDGTYFLGNDVTMTSPVRFEGKITQPVDKVFILRSNFDYPAYADAFDDETLGLKKALQALIRFADHDTLDLRGRRIDLIEPIDVAAIVPTITTQKSRRVIRNGFLRASPSAAWDPDVVVASATYSTSNNAFLTNVENIGAIAVGARVDGPGVGREIYVTEKDDSAGEIRLSQPLYGVSGTQSFTFTREKYMLDFSGFEIFSQLMIDSVQFNGGTIAGGVMLAPSGIWNSIRSCWFAEPGNRAITSPGTGCAGLTIEQNEFIAGDGSLAPSDRSSIGFNTNGNDVKIRDNRGIGLRHFGFIGGTGAIVSGNHFWQLDPSGNQDRTAGLIYGTRRAKTTIVGNYIDNQFIEFTNEYRTDAVNSSGLDFGRITITGNIMTASDVPAWFRFISLVPIGTGHYLDGLTVADNTIQLFSTQNIDRIEGVNTSQGSLDFSRFVDVVFTGNSYWKVNNKTESPALIEVSVSFASGVWTVDASEQLPFGGYAMGVDSVVAHGPITNGGGIPSFAMPWVDTRKGASQNQVTLNWEQSVTGTVQCRVRVDRPA